MYCMHCGVNCPEIATFCPNCGKSLHSSNRDQTISLASSQESIAGAQGNGARPVIWRLDFSSGAKWLRPIAIPLVILAWIGLTAVILWAASHVARSLILVSIAAILAFALAPAVKFLQKRLPRLLSILLVYVFVFGGISVIIYFLMRTAVIQINELKGSIGTLLKPASGSPPSPLEATLQSLGIDQTQLQNARQILVSHLAGLANEAIPVLRDIFNFVLDVIVVAMISIYFLLDGARLTRRLRENMPLSQQKRGFFLLDTLEHVVGGYIRGQLILSLLIGLLVGLGMAAFQVPHPILLGELAFLLAFVPVLGTFISAAACILLSFAAPNSWLINLTHQSWLLAIVVLLYFIGVHAIESHIVGPRVVGHAVGLHPIISIAALIAGAELFGILGALFVAPVVGIIQAIIVSLWREWRVAHPEQFPQKSATVESKTSQPAVGEVS
ncbi:MAG TPA: AI-2E family transporter [Ktedonobacteraceae bacterium]|nr:AI-2E family transporter [Ktedonobacteraceae bacterium]